MIVKTQLLYFMLCRPNTDAVNSLVRYCVMFFLFTVIGLYRIIPAYIGDSLTED